MHLPSPQIRRVLASSATAALLLGAAGAAFSPASASAATGPACDTTSCTETFTYSGAIETFTVPANVTDVTVTVSGAQGGQSRYAGGGAGGATVSGDLSVAPDQQLTVLVGQAGSVSGGQTYGGGGASPSYYDASGGGGSFIFNASADLLVAAGGGGGGSQFGGGGAGAGAGGTGGSGGTSLGYSGATGPSGGTPTSGGVHGNVYATYGGDGSGPAADGAPGRGGDGGGQNYDGYYPGGGGGGGYYGGGGGAYTQSGAGGSGYAAPAITNLISNAGQHGGNGVVSIRWALAPSTVTLSANPSSGAAVGDPVTLTAAISGLLGPATGTVRFDANGSPLGNCLVQPVTNGVATCVTTAVAGVNPLLASYSGDSTYAAKASGPASYQGAYPTVVSVTAAETVFGQDVTATATVSSAGGNPAGSVQFAVDGTDVGAPVGVVDGSAASPVLTGAGASPLTVGSHTISASFVPSDLTAYAGSTGPATQVVDQAGTSTSVAVQQSTITAAAAAVAPGAGVPSGSVTFSVGGTDVGTANLVNGVATLDYSVPTGMTQAVAAVYAGDLSFTGSSASTSRSDPAITATVTSAHAKSRAGWYRDAVTVTFQCATNGAALTAPCPSPVQLAVNGAAQSVTRTIVATDGGVATLTVGGINVDRTLPSVALTGLRNGATYGGRAPVARCVARDALSGVAACHISRRTSGTLTTYTASAADQAGNVRTVHGSYRVLSIYVQGASYRNGAFVVRAGHRYTVVVTNQAGRPTYYNAAIVPHRPTRGGMAFRAAGHHQWTMTVSINPAMRSHHFWNLGVKAGPTMHYVKVQVVG